MAGSTQHVVRQFSGEGANPHTLSLMWASNVEYDILRSVTAYMRPTAIQQLAVVGRSLAEGSSPATRWNQIFPDLHAQAAREDAASSAERPRTRNAPPASGDEPPELPFKISNAAKAGMLAICAMFADSKGDSAKPAREFSEWNLSHEKAEESIQRLKLCASELGIASNASQLTMKLYYAIPKSIRSEVVRLLPAGVSLQQASIDNLALALSSHTATTAYAEAFRPQAAVESGQRGGFRGTNRAFSTQARASSPDTHRPAAGGTDWRTAPDDGAAPRLCYACGKPGHIAARCPTRTEPRGASGRGGGAPQHAQRPAAPGGRGGRGQRPYVRQPNADGKNAQKSAFKAAAAVESEGGASLATLERDLSDLRELIESAQMGGSSTFFGAAATLAAANTVRSTRANRKSVSFAPEVVAQPSTPPVVQRRQPATRTVATRVSPPERPAMQRETSSVAENTPVPRPARRGRVRADAETETSMSRRLPLSYNVTDSVEKALESQAPSATTELARSMAPSHEVAAPFTPPEKRSVGTFELDNSVLGTLAITGTITVSPTSLSALVEQLFARSSVSAPTAAAVGTAALTAALSRSAGRREAEPSARAAALPLGAEVCLALPHGGFSVPARVVLIDSGADKTFVSRKCPLGKTLVEQVNIGAYRFIPGRTLFVGALGSEATATEGRVEAVPFRLTMGAHAATWETTVYLTDSRAYDVLVGMDSNRCLSMKLDLGKNTFSLDSDAKLPFGGHLRGIGNAAKACHRVAGPAMAATGVAVGSSDAEMQDAPASQLEHDEDDDDELRELRVRLLQKRTEVLAAESELQRLEAQQRETAAAILQAERAAAAAAEEVRQKAVAAAKAARKALRVRELEEELAAASAALSELNEKRTAAAAELAAVTDVVLPAQRVDSDPKASRVAAHSGLRKPLPPSLTLPEPQSATATVAQPPPTHTAPSLQGDTDELIAEAADEQPQPPPQPPVAPRVAPVDEYPEEDYDEPVAETEEDQPVDEPPVLVSTEAAPQPVSFVAAAVATPRPTVGRWADEVEEEEAREASLRQAQQQQGAVTFVREPIVPVYSRPSDGPFFEENTFFLRRLFGHNGERFPPSMLTTEPLTASMSPFDAMLWDLGRLPVRLQNVTKCLHNKGKWILSEADAAVGTIQLARNSFTETMFREERGWSVPFDSGAGHWKAISGALYDYFGARGKLEGLIALSRGEVQHQLRGISPSEWNVSVFQFVKSILSEITPEPFGLGPIMMADFFVEQSALIIIYGIYQTADREPTLNNAVATFLRHVGEPMPWDTRSFPEKRLLHLLIDNFAAAPLLLALPFVALAFDEMIPEFQCTVVTGLGGLGMCHAYSLWESDWSAAANPDTFCLTVLNLGCVARIQGPLVVSYRRYEAQPASSRLGVKSSSDNSRARRQLAASPDGDFIKKPQAKRGRTAASEQLRGHATTRGGLSARIMVGSHRNQFSGARYATTSAPIVRTAAAAIVADEYGTMMADKAQPSPNVLAPPPTAPLAAAPPPTAHPPSHAAAVASCSRQYGEAVDTLHELLAECPADSRRDIIASAVLQRMESELTLGSGLVNARVAQNIAATCSIVAVYDIISDSDVLMSAVAERLEACTVSVNDEGEALLRGSSTVQPLARSGVKQGPGGGNAAVGAAALDRGRPQRWSAAQKGKAKANGERALAAY